MPKRSDFILGIGIGGIFLYSLFRWFRRDRLFFPYHRHAQIKDETPTTSLSTGLVNYFKSCIGDKTPKRDRRVRFTTNAPVEIPIVRKVIMTQLNIGGI